MNAPKYFSCGAFIFFFFCYTYLYLIFLPPDIYRAAASAAAVVFVVLVVGDYGDDDKSGEFWGHGDHSLVMICQVAVESCVSRFWETTIKLCACGFINSLLSMTMIHRKWIFVCMRARTPLHKCKYSCSCSSVSISGHLFKKVLSLYLVNTDVEAGQVTF